MNSERYNMLQALPLSLWLKYYNTDRVIQALKQQALRRKRMGDSVVLHQ